MDVRSTENTENTTSTSKGASGAWPGQRGIRRFRGGPGFGGQPHGGHGGPRGRGGRGRRQRRGDVRSAVLVLLEEQPRNGYQLIGEIAERSEELWTPSPGSIYPVLAQLVDEGLVEETPGESGRTYRLTSSGAAYVEASRAELGKPWEEAAKGPQAAVRELMRTGREAMLAARQVVMVGSPAQVARATLIMAETRKALYGLLGEGEPTEED